MPRGDYLGEFEEIVLLAVARLDRGGVRHDHPARDREKRTGRACVDWRGCTRTVERLEDKGLVAVGKGDAESVARRTRATVFHGHAGGRVRARRGGSAACQSSPRPEAAPQFARLAMATIQTPPLLASPGACWLPSCRIAIGGRSSTRARARFVWAQTGGPRARMWYWRQVVMSVPAAWQMHRRDRTRVRDLAQRAPIRRDCRRRTAGREECAGAAGLSRPPRS